MFITENNTIRSIKIIDNGIGFNDKNFKSFQTAFFDNKSLSGAKDVDICLGLLKQKVLKLILLILIRINNIQI